MVDIMQSKRRALAFIFVSNKFVLSDIFWVGSETWTSAHASWVDSAQIASLIEEISI